MSSRAFAGNDPVLGNSIGGSGHIAIESPQIKIDANAKLLAHVEDGSSFSAGNVTLLAKDTALTADFSIIGFTKNIAKITLDQTVIRGNNIAIQAEAKDLTLSDAVPKWPPIT